MKCRFFLFFVSLLFLATPTQKLQAPSTPITSITVDPGLTQEQLDAMGTTTRDGRVATAKTVANRALAGTDIVTKDDAATLAKTYYDSTQATIKNLDDDKKDAEKEVFDNTMGLSFGMVGVAGAAAGIGAWKYSKNNKVSRKNALRKARHAREIIEKMADQHAADQEDPRKATKLKDALAAIMSEERNAVTNALDKTKDIDVARRKRFLEQVGQDHDQFTQEKERRFGDAWDSVDPQIVPAPTPGHPSAAHGPVHPTPQPTHGASFAPTPRLSASSVVHQPTYRPPRPGTGGRHNAQPPRHR